MKAKIIISAMALLCQFFNVSAQQYNVSDSINIFFDSLFMNMEDQYLFKEKVDFELVKPIIKKQALKSENFETSLSSVSFLFDTIQDSHCGIFYNEKHYSNTHGRQFTKDDFSTEFLIKYQDNPKFETQIINGKYGYVLIPGMLLMGLTEDSLHQVTQDMYDQIMSINDSQKIEGWIIDLRFNIGGNAYPMIASLYYLLGNTIVYTELGNDMKIKNTNYLKNGKFFGVNDKLETYINPKASPNSEVPVAIITGILTASAGEDIAVAFKGRENVSFIGEPSYGFLTGNDEVFLPFDITMVMTTCYIADRNGVYYKKITPDISTSKKDDFTDLTKDDNIIEAIKFFNSK